MSASSSIETATGSVVVVTHVITAPQVAAPQNSAGKNKFSRARLVALGTVQIMIGLPVFLFELAMTPDADTLGIYSGAFVWGPLIYIMSGSLTVAAGTSFNNSLVKGGLGLGVLAALASAAATTIYSVDVFGFTVHHLGYNCCYQNYNCVTNTFYCDVYWTRVQILSGVLAGFSFLEFIVSTCITVFGCKASCQPTDQPIIITNQNHEDASQVAETPPTYEAPPITPAPPPPESGYETVKPLEYNTIIL